jgi:two-component system, chemotaxis family, protein-glutamate methylesterase/glutaminase
MSATLDSWAPQRVRGIVIGASAGGIEALTVVLPALPGTLRAAVFVVIHLPPDQPSLLVDIFKPRCAVAVREAQDKDVAEAGCLYFAPPDYHLLVEPGPQIALSADAPVHFSRPSIDALFESAADVYGDGLLAIVLTGASEDGADGLAAVHAAGGQTLVQDPAGAVASAMPSFAIAHVPGTPVLPLDGMAALLRGLGTTTAGARR